MKRLLWVTLVVAAISICAFDAEAQVPFLQVFFDNGSGLEPVGYCPSEPIGTVVDTVYIVAFNFNMWMQAIEYMVDYSAALSWLADNVFSGALVIGASPTGITIAFPIPQDAFNFLVVQKATVLWMCDDCDLWCDTPVRVFPHPVSGKCRTTSWPDLLPTECVGMTSIICPCVIGTEETTWGRIKSLYR